MSITKLARMRDGTTLDVSTVQNVNDASVPTISIKEPWRLHTSGETTVMEAYGLINESGAIPDFGSSYSSSYPNVIVTDTDIKHDQKQQTKFIVTVTYSDEEFVVGEEVDEGDSGDNEGSGFSTNQQYTSSPVENQRVVTVNKSGSDKGDSIAFSNGRPVSPAFVESFPLNRITVTRNQRSFSTSDFGLQSKINSGSMRINGVTFKKQTVQLESIGYNTQNDNDGRAYYAVSYTLLINPDTFVRKYIQADTHENKKGRLVAMAGGLNRAWKLKDDGEFMDEADQTDPAKFEEGEAWTLEDANLSKLGL